MSSDWLSEKLKDPEFRRSFQEELEKQRKEDARDIVWLVMKFITWSALGMLVLIAAAILIAKGIAK